MASAPREHYDDSTPAMSKSAELALIPSRFACISDFTKWYDQITR